VIQDRLSGRPHLLSGRAIAPSRLALTRLASALQDPDIQLDELERLISADVALSYRLLKYINSAYFGLRSTISSIKHRLRDSDRERRLYARQRYRRGLLRALCRVRCLEQRRGQAADRLVRPMDGSGNAIVARR
jgi:hypothetical protein